MPNVEKAKNSTTPFVLPVFAKFPAEGQIIGRLLVGYGELEIALCRCVAEAVDDLDMVVKEMFGTRMGEYQRIKKAVSIGIHRHKTLELIELFNEIICEMHHCRNIRISLHTACFMKTQIIMENYCSRTSRT
jgi:hypothetical protein